MDLRDPANSSICEPQPRQSSLKILVVDDEVAILEYLDKLLSNLGHSVHTFVGCSTGTALKIIETAAADMFDVAIIDVVMPGIDGMQLIEFLHRVSPATQFISSDCGLCVDVSIELMKKGIPVRPWLRPFDVKILDVCWFSLKWREGALR